MKKPKPKNLSSAIKSDLSPWWNRERFHYLVLFSGAFLLYGWTVQFDYNLDDDYILSLLSGTERSLHGISTLFRQWFGSSDYRPVSVLSFWAERWLTGSLTAATSHLVNVVLFACILMAIYRLVIISRFYENTNLLKWLAFLTGLFFLVHPNHVSVVANIKSRDNLLSMLFGLLAAAQLILAYDKRQYFRIPIFFLFILIGLLAKRDSYAFFIYPILIMALFRKANISSFLVTGFILLILGFFLIKLYGAFTTLPDKSFFSFTMRFSENPLVNGSTFLEKLSFSLTTLFYYIKFLFVPFGYYFYFGYNQIPLQSFFCFKNCLTLLTCLLLFILAIREFKKNRLYLFSLFGFLFSIGYCLNLYILISGIVMDRYNFIPSLFFCLSLAAIFIDLDVRKYSSKFRYLLPCGILLLYSIFTICRTADWRNFHTLFDADLPHLNQSATAYRLAGGTYIHLALTEEMKAGYDKTLTDSFIQKGENYILHSLNVYDQSPQAWELAGLCDFYRKNYPNAISKFKKCFQADSSYYSGINYIGATYWNMGKIDSAYYYFNYVMQREPIYNYSARNLVDMLAQNGRKEEADSIMKTLLKRFPNDGRLQNKAKEFYNKP